MGDWMRDKQGLLENDRTKPASGHGAAPATIVGSIGAWLLRVVLLLPLLTLLAPLAARAADASDIWERFFGGSNRDTSIAVAAFKDGGVISAGYTRSVGNGDADILLLRLAKDGSLMWQKTFGGPARDLATAVSVLPDGGFITAAVTQSGEGEGEGEGEGDALIIRHNSSGDIIWQKRFGAAQYDIPYAVQVDRKGHIIVAGYTKSAGKGDADGWIFELDTKGELLWEHTYGTEGRDWFRSLAVLANGDIVVAGGTKADKSTATNAWVMRLDAAGKRLWERTYAEGESVARTVVVLQDGAIVVAGSVLARDSLTGRDIWIAKLNGKGEPVFEKKLGGTGNDQTEALIALPDGQIALVGGTTKNLAVITVRTAWMMRLDKRGKLLWKRTFEGKSDQLFGLSPLPGERIVASGTSWQQNKGEDVWILTLDKHGHRTLAGEQQLQTSIQ